MSGKRKNAVPEETGLTILRIKGGWSASLRGYKKKIRQWAEAAGATQGLSVVLADDVFVQELNHRYRGKNKPTNVLSFTGADSGLGDVVLAYETVKREAAGQKKSFAFHTAHLVIHGILHLRGLDHETEADATLMEAEEINCLKKLGFSNPYEV